MFERVINTLLRYSENSGKPRGNVGVETQSQLNYFQLAYLTL